MNRLVTVSNALISAIVDGVPLPEDDKRRMVADAGLSWETVRDVNGRTSILVLSRLWDDVLRRTGDPFVGLQIGNAVPGERFGLAVHAARHSETFREMLRRFCKYASLINAMIKCSLAEEPERTRFKMKFYWDVLDLERHAVDITFVAFMNWARRHVGPKFVLREIRLRHSLAAGRPKYDAIFGVPVVLGASTNEVLFDSVALDETLGESDLELGRILDVHADAELAKIPVIASLPERVAQILARELRLGNKTDLKTVAGELKMAPRHLQRKLSESSTTFSTLLDDARRSLAPALLAERSASVGQVAFRLGYAEPTAFIRAFKKWYGVTPGNYRPR